MTVGERALDVLDQALMVELTRRDIDTDLKGMAFVMPNGRLLAGLREYPATDWDDQPGLLGERNEGIWRDDSARGVSPAESKVRS